MNGNKYDHGPLDTLRKGTMQAIVFLSIIAVAGCQAGARPILPLFGRIDEETPHRVAALGPPSAASAANEITLTALIEKRGEPAKETTPEIAKLNETLRTCFERDQIIDLESAFQLANGANPTIGLADEVVRANLAERMLARALLFPTLNIGATLSLHSGGLLTSAGLVREVNRDSVYFGAGSDVRATGPVAVPGLQIAANLSDAVFAPRVADRKVTSSRYDAEATRNNVLLEVARSYLALVGAEARLLAWRQSEKEFAGVAELTANFSEKGQGRESDALRAKSELSLLQSNAEQTDEDIIAWATELARSLSTDPSVRLRPEPGTPPLIQLVDERTPLESLILTALASRPEIGARSADVALYETRLRQERIRPLAPTIAVGVSSGDFGGGSNLVGYRFSHFGGRTDIDVLAVWTLQNLGFGNRALQKQVRAEIGQAEASRAAVIDQVRREVADALAQTKTSRLQMDIARRRVETAQKAYRQDLERTRNRVGHLIEVLSSLNLLASARQDLVQAMVDYSQSQFQLYVAIGGMPSSPPSADAGKK